MDLVSPQNVRIPNILENKISYITKTLEIVPLQSF